MKLVIAFYILLLLIVSINKIESFDPEPELGLEPEPDMLNERAGWWPTWRPRIIRLPYRSQHPQVQRLTRDQLPATKSSSGNIPANKIIEFGVCFTQCAWPKISIGQCKKIFDCLIDCALGGVGISGAGVGGGSVIGSKINIQDTILGSVRESNDYIERVLQLSRCSASCLLGIFKGDTFNQLTMLTNLAQCEVDCICTPDKPDSPQMLFQYGDQRGLRRRKGSPQSNAWNRPVESQLNSWNTQSNTRYQQKSYANSWDKPGSSQSNSRDTADRGKPKLMPIDSEELPEPYPNIEDSWQSEPELEQGTGLELGPETESEPEPEPDWSMWSMGLQRLNPYGLK